MVERLLADQAERVTRLGGLVGRGDVPAGEVRRADVDDVAGGDEAVHRLPHLLPCGGAVHVVHLVEVDVFGLEPLQGGDRRAAHVDGGQLREVRHLFVEGGAIALGGQHHLVAAAGLGEPAPDDLLGAAAMPLTAVAVGGVEEVDARVEGAVHDGVRVLFRGVRAEVHGAEHDARDEKAGTTEVGVLHGVLQLTAPPPYPRPACGGGDFAEATWHDGGVRTASAHN